MEEFTIKDKRGCVESEKEEGVKEAGSRGR